MLYSLRMLVKVILNGMRSISILLQFERTRCTVVTRIHRRAAVVGSAEELLRPRYRLGGI